LKERTHLLKDDLLEHETLEFYCSKEEDRVHEGKAGGRQNYLRHTNRDKWMSHLAISPEPLHIQSLNFMAISSVTTKKTPSHDKSQFG
jgi:hypothetical protein